MAKDEDITLSRDVALQACPVALKAVREEHTEAGGLVVSVSVKSPKWHRWLGAKGQVLRSYELDPFGQEIYRACDGTRDVVALTREFAAAHSLSYAEAEMSVTRFLNTLMGRGLIIMAVEREETVDE
ncbi:MAG: PqqD family protein [Lentisphaerae bacterium]|nr:PqqD family protein [Lentisphaerota bacterium]MBT4816659.1 PqqD family protein [Lentisphaerota bacterium]MBT5606384.1 PqqD family protein [Lentisphaerota bacterium]MBT7056761.1 PqqD family protein [Lentisphaerota bacterium]MBT7840366.1 PqqD family protein [Lentisphaerota bacterium]